MKVYICFIINNLQHDNPQSMAKKKKNISNSMAKRIISKHWSLFQPDANEFVVKEKGDQIALKEHKQL